MRLNLVTFEGPALGIGLQIQLAGFAANSVVIKLLDSAESHFISTYKAQHVGRQRVIWIKALRLFARINTFKVQRIQFGGEALVEAPHDPNELLICLFPLFQMIGE